MSGRADVLGLPALAPILRALPRARLVGGCVRDTLLGLPVADIDLATPDPPNRMQELLEAAGLRVIPTGAAHGTLTVLSDGLCAEITTLRRDTETDGRHARVAWTDDWREDAARRDFTINAMSLDQGGTLHDPFGGQADLAAGRVRFVGEAVRRIAEDRLRILRYFRFYARYGAPPPDPEAVRAITDAAPDVAKLSAERVWSEIKRILSVPDPRATLALMAELGVLPHVLPGARLPGMLPDMLARGVPADPVLRLSGILTAEPAALAARLKMSGAEQARLSGLLTGPIPEPGNDDGALRRLLADTPAELLIGRAWRAYPRAQALRDRLASMPKPVFPLGGRDALEAGWVPGPAMGQALAAVRHWWLQGGCLADADACRARLRTLTPVSAQG